MTSLSTQQRVAQRKQVIYHIQTFLMLTAGLIYASVILGAVLMLMGVMICG